MEEKIIEQFLWDYLMDCLAIHHFVKNRNIQTIPEAQKICKEKIKQLLREKIKGMRKENDNLQQR